MFNVNAEIKAEEKKQTVDCTFTLYDQYQYDQQGTLTWTPSEATNNAVVRRKAVNTVVCTFTIHFMREFAQSAH